MLCLAKSATERQARCLPPTRHSFSCGGETLPRHTCTENVVHVHWLGSGLLVCWRAKPTFASCRSHFNEEPFLRALLQLHSAAMEMRRRDFLSGNWAAHITRASQLKPSYRQADADQPASQLVDGQATILSSHTLWLAMCSEGWHI